MNTLWFQALALLALLWALALPLGRHIARVLEGEPTFLHPVLGPLERWLLRWMGVVGQEMGWRDYAAALLVFNGLGLALTFLLLRAQGGLGLNPDRLPAVPVDLAFNLAASFVSNTNWQPCAGETTLSPLSQMAGLAVQNFLSPATGLAVLAALTRGLARRASDGLGNAWVDLVRGVLYVLLPLALLLAVLLLSQGVMQTFAGAVDTPAGRIPRGPVASQVAIRVLGVNGGGYFGANAAHPLENPTPLTGFLQTLAILLVPAALCHTFGRMVRDRRQGWALLTTMTLLFTGALASLAAAERAPVPALAALGVAHPQGSLEGKEVRFGTPASVLFTTATTAASCGAVEAMHDSLSPMGGLVPLWLIQSGEVVFGGVGTGLAGLVLFALVGVFMGGLMVGRTPEYLGKKLEAFDLKMVAVAILLPPALALAGTAAGVLVPAARASIASPGPHGFTQVLYAFSSAANNNGSAFAGLQADTPFYTWTLAAVMLLGRFGTLVPTLALAGALAARNRTPEGPGTLPTHTPLFLALLVAVVLLVGALTFLPSLALGPLAEHLAGPGGGP